jgi:hypothetical protein
VFFGDIHRNRHAYPGVVANASPLVAASIGASSRRFTGTALSGLQRGAHC